MSKETTPQSNNNEEVDLGQLFKIIGNGFRNLFLFIKSIFVGLFDLVMLFLIFIQKHFIKFVIAGVLGLLLGFYLEKEQGDIFESKMIVEPNFKSVEQLYNNISFYNRLAKEKDTLGLVKAFALSSNEEAGSILKIVVEPYNNENKKIEQFNNFVKRLDTTTIKAVTYEDYLKNYDELDASYHQISLISNNKFIAKKIQNVIVESISENEYFKLQKQISDENIELKGNIFKEQLTVIDSLQEVYKKVLIETAKYPNTGTNINLANEKTSSNKELEILDKKELIKDELVDLNLERARKNNTINIISDFPERSVKVQGLLKSKKLYYAGVFILLTLGFLLLIEVNKFIKNYKEQRQS